VNLASRLERYSSGDDVIVSQSVRDDPEVSQFLLENERMIAEPFAAELKGFEGRDFRLWRVACAAPE
jgi:class 3 adenylate cyclase